MFQQQISSYNEISGGTILGNESNDEQVFNASTTGSASIVNGAGFPIGFPFAFGGEVFTRFAVGTNGYIKLGNNTFSIANTVSSAFTGIPFNLPDTVAYAQMLAALHGDLQGQTGSELSFKTIGTEPNRECIIQWKRYRIYLATTDDFNFQIRLKEQDNKVVFSYGNFTKGPNPNLISVGIRGAAYNVVQMRKAQQIAGETWSTSTKSTDRTKQCNIQSAFKPDNGLEYTFYNPAQTANDIGLDKASLSAGIQFGCQGSAAETITVRIFNYGDSTQGHLPYRIKINNEEIQDDTLILNPPLLKNQTRIVTINQTIDLSQPTDLNVKIWSQLAGDTGVYAVNDTAMINTRIFASVPTPAAPIKSFSEFIGKGWKTYRGINKPESNNGRFIASTQFISQTTSIQVLGFSSDTIQDWLVSPAFQPTANLRLKFRAAITDFDTITPLTGGIDNDEIKFLISDDCGASWNTIFMFDNNSVSSGLISNIKNGFSVPIPQVSGPFQLAIFVNNKGTGPQNTYFFHVDDITLNQGNSYDLGAGKVSIDNQNNPNCDQISFTVKAWVKNEGDSTLNSGSASVTVNNAAPQIDTFTFSPALASGDSAQITFNTVAIPPNSNIKLVFRTLLEGEDGFSAGNDTASISFVYIGTASPLPVPSTINFDNLPSGIPAGWLVEQNQGSDFKIRVRGTNSTRSLSALFFSSNNSSYAIAPTTSVLPFGAQLTFDLRIKNDLMGPFSFGTSDSVTARVSIDCGTSWITVFKAKAGQPFGFDNFQTASISLEPFAGSAVALRFNAVINRSDNTGAWLDIDNIGISSSTEVTGIQAQNDFLFWPNPAKNIIRFNLPKVTGNVKARILSADGRILLEEDASDQSELATGNIPPGIYLIEVVSEAGTFRKRLVKE